ncbi:hypothetical protein [Micromonospora sp. NPDC002717]
MGWGIDGEAFHSIGEPARRTGLTVKAIRGVPGGVPAALGS